MTLDVVMTSNVESFREGEDENNNEIIYYLEDGSGFDLNWTILPAQDPWQKLAAMMAGGNPPDVVYCPDKGVFAEYLHRNALADLTDYVAQAENIQRLVPEDTWSAVTWDGRIYAVPIPQNQHISGSTGMFTRLDWLEELGLEKPETLDEFRDVLSVIKEEKGVIPLTTTPGNGVLDGFSGAFGIGTTYKVKDGEVVFSYVQPEALEYLTYMKGLYAEGLLDQEFPVNESANVQEKLVADQAAMSITGWWDALPIGTNFKDKHGEDAVLEYIAPPHGDEEGEFGVARRGPIRTYLLIPAQSEHVQEAVDFLDFMCREDVYTFVSFGEEGVHYEVRDGEYYLLDEYQNRRFQMYYVLVDTQEGFAVRLRDKGFKEYSDQVVDWYTLRPISQYAPPMPEVMGISTDISNLTEEYFVQFITGDLPLDAFDEYVSEWEALGGKDAVAALNDWYQTQ
ncbi:MAG: extracellular solute-binding protein [Anaerolineae bacterium]